ncbi:MAG TPA: DNA methyltransferase [Ktedonobacterales bacterium]|nr:DNA methyltransferase [Ktedonobacterales bacterium]
MSSKSSSAASNMTLPLFPHEPVVTPQLRAVSRKDHLTFKANREHGRHGWLRLTPAYSVHIVEDLLVRYGRDDIVLDPFCGSGTTALVCAQAGMACDTIDINPFLVWLTNAKCAAYTGDDISTADLVLCSALSGVAESFAVDAPATWIPPIKDVEKWWEHNTLCLLAEIFTRLRHVDVSAPARDLLTVIFCRVAIELASVSFGHQSMSFKKPGPTPVLLETPRYEHVRAAFDRAKDGVFRSARVALHEGTAQAMLGDSRRVESVVRDRRYSVVITSPPYPNRMSYIRELRPYMYWLGYLTNGRQAGELDWQAIGGTWGCATSNLMAWTPPESRPIPYGTFDEVVERITGRSKVLGIYVRKYFCDMVEHIHSVRAVLSAGATVHYVIGNSKFYDVMLHTEQIYAAILRDAGFQDVTVEMVRKRTSKKELFEYIVSARA